jgi:hypothetical protein
MNGYKPRICHVLQVELIVTISVRTAASGCTHSNVYTSALNVKVVCSSETVAPAYHCTQYRKGTLIFTTMGVMNFMYLDCSDLCSIRRKYFKILCFRYLEWAISHNSQELSAVSVSSLLINDAVRSQNRDCLTAFIWPLMNMEPLVERELARETSSSRNLSYCNTVDHICRMI